MQRWFAGRRADGFPVLVAEAEARVAGFGSYGPFRRGEGYRRTVEHSVYVHRHFRKRGIGGTLLGALIDHATARRLGVMIGGISADQPASLALHRAFGFREVGRLPGVGEKQGRRLDLVLLARDLADA